jgi:hypothetical protein
VVDVVMVLVLASSFVVAHAGHVGHTSHDQFHHLEEEISNLLKQERVSGCRGSHMKQESSLVCTMPLPSLRW